MTHADHDELERLRAHARELEVGLSPVAVRAFRETVVPAIEALGEGAEIFHAAAVAREERAALICGGPGAGKSTLVAKTLLQTPSARYVADDASAITLVGDRASVHPATGPVRVEGELGRRLQDCFGGELGTTTRSRVAWYAPADLRPAGPVALEAVVVLDEDADASRRPRALEAVRRILGHVYVRGFADSARHRRILKVTTVLAALPVVVTPRASGRDTLDELLV